MLDFSEIKNLSAIEKLSYCDTQYPVILVSGLGLKDQTRLLHYWGIIPDFLKQYGCDVYTANQDAFLSIADNGIKLKYRILDILTTTNKDKINIIGHSKGGIEARYTSSMLGIHQHIASVTTLGTPHHGAKLAEIVLGKIPIPKIALSRLVNIYARLIGDDRPDSLRSVIQVTTDAMKKFNDEVPDISSIYYQSYAAHINKDYTSQMWKAMAAILKPFEGSNDGIVGIESAKWGNYKGLMQTTTVNSVSHGDMVGLSQFIGNTKFDAKRYMAHIIHELKLMGY